MKIIVAGGRDFGHRKLPDGKVDEEWRAKCWNYMSRVFNQLVITNKLLPTIVSGCADGADTLAIELADLHGIPVQRMPADWDQYGKAAGPIRNQQMAQEADVLIAFWDGRSRGTRDMIQKAVRSGLEVHIYRY